MGWFKDIFEEKSRAKKLAERAFSITTKIVKHDIKEAKNSEDQRVAHEMLYLYVTLIAAYFFENDHADYQEIMAELASIFGADWEDIYDGLNLYCNAWFSVFNKDGSLSDNPYGVISALAASRCFGEDGLNNLVVLDKIMFAAQRYHQTITKYLNECKTIIDET